VKIWFQLKWYNWKLNSVNWKLRVMDSRSFLDYVAENGEAHKCIEVRKVFEQERLYYKDRLLRIELKKAGFKICLKKKC
jgi:hypothetical protein